MFLTWRLNDEITIKSPSIPLFQRGKPSTPPFVKERRGGIFKTLKD
jgi:hypothetical protein